MVESISLIPVISDRVLVSRIVSTAFHDDHEV